VFSSQTGIGDDHEPGVDDAGDPAEDCQDDVEDEGAGAAFAHEDCEGREIAIIASQQPICFGSGFVRGFC
jgi:hypothetical protein